MPIARITTPGLAAMGVSVVLLWSCIIAEKLVVRSAVREQSRVLYEIRVLRQRQRAEPAAAPLPYRPNLRPTARG